jgi:methylisocitrate lyase
MTFSAGKNFWSALQQERPLQIIGCVNAYLALMAERVGYRALYLSGAGVANASYGLPDLGMTSLDNVLEDVRRITDAVDLPLLVDIDTGWGNKHMIAKTVKSMIKAGAAAVHIEDQVSEKRCGHRPGKRLVSTQEMVNRIKAAVDARTDPHFVIMARTDALAHEGLDACISRVSAYKEAGADMIFPEALTTLDQYRAIKSATGRPILANITEFGMTPLFTVKDLASANVDMALYPLSTFRAMNFAALNTMETIKNNGGQESLIPNMQTREELYDFLDYHMFEESFNETIKT